MPFDGNKWTLRKFVPYRKMLAAVMAQYPDLQRISDGPNDTSKVRQALLFGGWFVLSTLPTYLSLFSLFHSLRTTRFLVMKDMWVLSLP